MNQGRARAAAALAGALAWAVLALGLGAVNARAATLSVSVVDADGKALADAVVAIMVKGVRAQAPAGTLVQIAQRERQFQPRLTVIQTGTSIAFPNFDSVRHHVYSFSPIQRFELRLYAGTPSMPVLFDKPGIATLGCNIHDRMQAWVVVVDTPHFARTDAAGVASLELPPGEHRIRTWHGLLGETAAPIEQAVAVTAAPSRLTIAVPGREARP